MLQTHENPGWWDAVGSFTCNVSCFSGIKENVDIIIPEYAKCFNELPELMK